MKVLDEFKGTLQIDDRQWVSYVGRKVETHLLGQENVPLIAFELFDETFELVASGNTKEEALDRLKRTVQLYLERQMRGCSNLLPRTK